MKRYSPENDRDVDEARMVPDEKGEWVHISEVERLTRERDEALEGCARDLARLRDDLTAPCHGLGCGRCVACVERAERERDEWQRRALDAEYEHGP